MSAAFHLLCPSTPIIPKVFIGVSRHLGVFMDVVLTKQIQDLIDALLPTEPQATQMLQTARTHHLSFGLAYSHLDDDIAQVIARLRYVLLLAQHHTPPGEPPNRP